MEDSIISATNEVQIATAPETQELIRKLIAIEEETRRREAGEFPPVKTHWVVNNAAKVYEKIRNTIDYREENVLRRSAIQRIISRRLRSREKSVEIAQGLVKELIQAGYIGEKAVLPNEVTQIGQVIKKNLYFARTDSERGLKYYLAIASAEIEEKVAPCKAEKAVLEYLESIAKKEIVNWEIDSKELKLIIAFYRIFLKYDTPLMRFLLLKKNYPEIINYQVGQSLEYLPKEKLEKAYYNITNELNNSLVKGITKLVKRYYPVYIFFQEVVIKNPMRFEKVFSEPKKLKQEISYFADESYAKTRQRLTRSVARAILFIIITKMALGIICELPYDLYIIKKVDFLPLIINLMFPPILMLVSASLIKVPGQSNTDKLISLIEDLVYKGADESFQKEVKIKGNLGFSTFMGILYFITFATTFGLLIWMLVALDFNLVSSFLFFFFLSVVSFFAFRIREGTKELLVVEEKEGAITNFLDFLLLPFLRIGHWLSIRFANVNIFLFLFDFVIEAPFKTILEVVENWMAFMKEKKEEMMS